MTSPSTAAPSREQLLHCLDGAAELEHNLMCTCPCAASGLKQGEAEGPQQLCGGSATQPFYDGGHARNGFNAA